MSTQSRILVKVPFCHGQHRFKIIRGQRWGAVDHLLLQEVVKGPFTAQQLSELSGLPRRLIIEIMIPFMRVGWVQITHQDRSYGFQATQRGMIVSSLEDLPVEMDLAVSFRQFIIDPITGNCYRVGGKNQNFQVYGKNRARELVEENRARLIELNLLKPNSNPDLSEIFECVAEVDEEVVGYEEYAFQRPYRQTIKFAIATVDEDNNIAGVPPETSTILKEQILKAADEKREQLRSSKKTSSNKLVPKFNFDVPTKCYPLHSLAESEYQLILGSQSHADHLINTIHNSCSRLVIHSTFINTENLNRIFDSLVAAARRSVQIDILWGQVEPEQARDKKAYLTTIESLLEFNQKIRNIGLSEYFVIHTDPTGSHAKIIISDDASGCLSATVGSCNWLASGFNRFEASVLLHQYMIVSEVVNIVSQLAKGLARVSNNLSRELAILASYIKKQSSQTKEPGSNGKVSAQIVLKGEHPEFVRKARDEAVNKIFVCSHRISHVSDRPIFTPLKASVGQASGVQAKVYYGATSGGMRREEVSLLADEIEPLGISLEKVGHPTIHAKILTWDSSDAVISSINWLSASTSGEDYDELGIYLKHENISNFIENEFLNYITR